MKFGNYLVLHFYLFVSTLYGQTASMQGNWILTTVETESRTVHPYIVTRFSPDGKVFFFDTEIGTWTMQNQGIELKSGQIELYNGFFPITEHTPDRLVLKTDSVTFHYRKAYDRRDNNPVFQNLTGTWLMRGTVSTYVRFDENGKFSMVEIQENGSVGSIGQWWFIPAENVFVVMADVDVLRKKDSILRINKDYMEVENEGIQYQLEKQPEVLAVEHLNFANDSVEYEVSGQTGLPWADDGLRNFLPGVKGLRYKHSVYLNDVKTFHEEYYSVDVDVNKEKHQIKFTTYKERDEERIRISAVTKGRVSYNNFFPQKNLDSYRIIDRNRPWQYDGKTYACTVVEGVNGHAHYQYWMINDMPGVFAKIIYESKGIYGNFVYTVTELEFIDYHN